MVISSSTKVDAGFISRMLTLRYDPLKRPVRAPLSPEDFTPRNYAGPTDQHVVQIIEEGLVKKHSKLGFRRASLSLSGGVDSGLTLAMLRSALPAVKLECIAVGFGETNDEVVRAEEIARIYDCNFHGIILEDILSDLPKLISIVREPKWNLYHYYALEEGRKKASVFYTGDGGDELFGGYTFRYQKFLSLLPSNGAGWMEKSKLYLSCHERDWVPDQDRLFGSAMRFSWNAIYQLFKPIFESKLDPLDQLFLADFNGKLLHDWLPANAAFKKSLGLEIESIFLTNKMIRFATHMPWNLKYDSATAVGKIPLRKILAKQKGFANLEPIKQGFAVNLGSMWKNKGAKEIVESYVNAGSEVVKKHIISAEWLQRTQKKIQEESEPDPRYVGKLFGILALEVWHRLFVSQTMSGKERL